jgi:hypothetical protein
MHFFGDICSFFAGAVTCLQGLHDNFIVHLFPGFSLLHSQQNLICFQSVCEVIGYDSETTS